LPKGPPLRQRPSRGPPLRQRPPSCPALRQPGPTLRQRPPKELPLRQQPSRSLPTRRRAPREPVLSFPARRRRGVKSSCPRVRLYRRRPRTSTMCTGSRLIVKCLAEAGYHVTIPPPRSMMADGGTPPRPYSKHASVAEATALIRAYAAQQARINAETARRLAALERHVEDQKRDKAVKAIGEAKWAEAQRLWFNTLRPQPL
jgi:hypothetical protein